MNVLVFQAHHMAYQAEINAHGDRAMKMIVVEEAWVGQKKGG